MTPYLRAALDILRDPLTQDLVLLVAVLSCLFTARTLFLVVGDLVSIRTAMETDLDDLQGSGGGSDTENGRSSPLRRGTVQSGETER